MKLLTEGHLCGPDAESHRTQGKIAVALDRIRRVQRSSALQRFPSSRHIWALEVEHSHILRIRDIVDSLQPRGAISTFMRASHEEGHLGEVACLLFTEGNAATDQTLPSEFLKYASRQFYLPFACRDPSWLVSRALAELACTTTTSTTYAKSVLKIAASPKELEKVLAEAFYDMSGDSQKLTASLKNATHMLSVVYSKEESLFRWGFCSTTFATENLLTCNSIAARLEQSRNQQMPETKSVELQQSQQPEAVCRAFYKIKECYEQTFPLILNWPLPDPETCISCDVGASPGGWTQFLSRHCARVIAVDPGLLDPAVLSLSNVTYIGATLQDSCVSTLLNDFAIQQQLKLKIVVCDVNFKPSETALMLCDHVIGCLDGLQSECSTSPSFVIFTLKLMKNPKSHHIEKAVAQVLEIFRAGTGSHGACWQHYVVHLTANSRNERTLLLRLH